MCSILCSAIPIAVATKKIKIDNNKFKLRIPPTEKAPILSNFAKPFDLEY
jgi:hypothetical protein